MRSLFPTKSPIVGEGSQDRKQTGSFEAMAFEFCIRFYIQVLHGVLSHRAYRLLRYSSTAVAVAAVVVVLFSNHYVPIDARYRDFFTWRVSDVSSNNHCELCTSEPLRIHIRSW